MNFNENKEKRLFKERIKFYADTPSAPPNKLFCFEIKSILTLREALWRFIAKGWNIRSAWYEKIDLTTGKVDNQRINIQQELMDYTYYKVNDIQMKKQGISFEKRNEYLKAALNNFH